MSREQEGVEERRVEKRVEKRRVPLNYEFLRTHVLVAHLVS
jgi:hypothetical protein